MRIENPTDHRIQKINYYGSHLDLDKTYKVSFATTHGVASKYGKNRKKSGHKAIEAMNAYLQENPEFTPDKLKCFSLV